MKKKLVALFLVATMVCGTLTGCQFSFSIGNSETESETAKDNDDSKKEDTSEADKENSEKPSDDKDADTNKDSEKESEEKDTSKDEKPSTENTEVSSDWKKYEFNINGKVLSLPCTYAELSDATGFSMKSSQAKSWLEGGYYTTVNLYNENEDLGLYIDITNFSKEDKQYTDCLVTYVGQSKYMTEDNEVSVITFPGNLVAGHKITEEELFKIFGEPTKVYRYQSEDSDYWSNTYTWSEDEDWTTFNCFEIDLTNGYIDQISLDRQEE